MICEGTMKTNERKARTCLQQLSAYIDVYLRSIAAGNQDVACGSLDKIQTWMGFLKKDLRGCIIRRRANVGRV